jgi:hypothetical protein
MSYFTYFDPYIEIHKYLLLLGSKSPKQCKGDMVITDTMVGEDL